MSIGSVSVEQGPYDEDDRRALFTLAHLFEPGDPIIGKSIEASSPMQTLQNVYAGKIKKKSQGSLTERITQFSYPREMDFYESLGARLLCRRDVGWPTQLTQLKESEPWVLWSLGNANFRILALKSIAMVGARACTSYGRNIAHQWAGECSSSGWTIFSGGAIGIDSAAHRGALAVAQPTVCILASGIDNWYPEQNRTLFSEILDSGCILSEVPPREPPRRQRFLSRNRILAAMTSGTVVVEAASRSGSTTTAQKAIDLGRIVGAVPGSIYSPQSVGTHDLLRNPDVQLLESAHQLLKTLDLSTPDVPKTRGHPDQGKREFSREWRTLPQRELDVWEAIPMVGSSTLDDVISHSGWSGNDVLVALNVLLEMNFVSFKDGSWTKLM